MFDSSLVVYLWCGLFQTDSLVQHLSYNVHSKYPFWCRSAEAVAKYCGSDSCVWSQDWSTCIYSAFFCWLPLWPLYYFKLQVTISMLSDLVMMIACITNHASLWQSKFRMQALSLSPTLQFTFILAGTLSLTICNWLLRTWAICLLLVLIEG